MAIIDLYHGSQKIIERPVLGEGNRKNDYGLGFYCTAKPEMAGEWACSCGDDGFINHYQLDTKGLRTINLNSHEFTILHWLEALISHRTPRLSGDIAPLALTYLQENFHVPVEEFDIVRGYRADDSYFAFASAFLGGSISLPMLQRAMKLGKLGEQMVPRTQKAYDQMTFLGVDIAQAAHYYPKKVTRDQRARDDFASMRGLPSALDEPRITDILREKWQADDPRLQ